MPTKKARLAITLEPEQYELLHRLAELQRRPMSAVIAELLAVAAPTLEMVRAALERAATIEASQLAALAQSLQGAQDKLAPIVDDLFSALEAASKSPSQEPTEGGSEGPEMRSQPPHSNTGVGFSYPLEFKGNTDFRMGGSVNAF